MPDQRVSPSTGSDLLLQAWRESFLRLVLRGAVIFGLIALIPTLFTDTNPIFFVVYGIAYLALLIAAFAPLAYTVRAWTFISLFYLLGISGLLDTGIWADSRLFFVLMAVITAMLISTRAAIGVGGLTSITAAIAGWFILTGRYVVTTREIPPGNLATWLSGLGTIIMLDAIVIIGISLLQSEFARAHERAATSLEELAAERQHLEERVEARTNESLHKTAQLEAAASVARRITGLRELRALLDDIVRTIAQQFNLYHVGILLLDENAQYASLEAASSDGGRQMVLEGYRLKAGAPGIPGSVIEQARARLVRDVRVERDFVENADLPMTRSEMALPLIVRERVIGILDVHSDEPDAFSESDMDTMQTLADQLATAIENARLFSEREGIIEQFQALTALQTPEAWRAFTRDRRPAFQYTPTGVRPVGMSSLGEAAKTIQAPLVIRGQQIGTITLRRKGTAPDWSPREEEMARDISAQVALALENARLLEETSRRAGMERVTSEISARISSSSLYESILRTAAEELSRALGGSEVVVQMQPVQPDEEVKSDRVVRASPND